MRYQTLLVMMSCLLLASTALGQRRELSLSDPAPGLDIEQWSMGGEVTIEKGSVYLVAFFEVEDDTTEVLMENLATLQTELGWKGLSILAISPDEPDEVQHYVGRHREKINFSVAVDRRDSTRRAWMGAAQLREFPVVFLVGKQGKVQYIGRETDEKFIEVFPLVLEGRYDAKLYERVQPRLDAVKNARRMRNFRMAMRMYDEIIELDPQVFANFTLEKFEMMLIEMRQREEAYTYARELIETYSSDPNALASLAEKIATDPVIPDDQRDLEVAMQAAERVAAVANPEEPWVYAIQALVHYHAGRIDEAVRLQRKAYFVARPTVKPEFKRVLDSYREAQHRQERVSG
jgi:tetratricopeptide (TPR) repeat protein